jgi:hypothetical protein
MTDSVFGWFQRMFDPAGRTGLQYTSKHRLWDTTKAACQGEAPETPQMKGEFEKGVLPFLCMHNALFFAIGFLIGALFGIVFMCLLQINRLNRKEEKDE